MKKITETDCEESMKVFEERFGPIVLPEDYEETGCEHYEEFEDAVKMARRLNSELPHTHLWTVVEVEGNQYLIAGNRKVDRLNWVVTAQPHGFTTQDYIFYVDTEEE